MKFLEATFKAALEEAERPGVMLVWRSFGKVNVYVPDTSVDNLCDVSDILSEASVNLHEYCRYYKEQDK